MLLADLDGLIKELERDREDITGAVVEARPVLNHDRTTGVRALNPSAHRRTKNDIAKQYVGSRGSPVCDNKSY